MEYCRRVYYYLPVTRGLTARDVVGTERETWNMCIWMTALIHFANSEKDDECMYWNGPVTTGRRPSVCGNNTSVSHIMVCLNENSGEALDEEGYYFEVAHRCRKECNTPEHLVYATGAINRSMDICQTRCIQGCEHNQWCIPLGPFKFVVPCYEHPDGSCFERNEEAIEQFNREDVLHAVVNNFNRNNVDPLNLMTNEQRELFIEEIYRAGLNR